MPAAPALLAQQVPSQGGGAEYPNLETAAPEAVGDSALKFFTPAQFANLRALAGILMPALNERPGALEAKAPEFLDFLLSRSPKDRQDVYRNGLEDLAAQARKRFNKDFSALDTASAVTLLEPLKQPWTFEPPTAPAARFLRDAKHDLRQATLNSREYSQALSAGGRRGGGLGLYWYPLD